MSAPVHGDADAARKRLARLKGESPDAPDAPKGDLPRQAENPWERPADRFLAEQAAVVAPRREAFHRLALTKEHAEKVAPLPDVAEAATATDAESAAKRLAAHARADVPLPEATREDAVKPPTFDAEDERPEPAFDVPAYEEAVDAKRARAGDEEAK